MINEEEKGHLTVMPTLEEVKRAVVDLNAHGAPGPDGYGAIFFQTFWEIVREDAFNAVKQFVLQDWMFPVWLPVAARIIDKNQNEFVQGRDIRDCIATTSEAINVLNRNSFDENVALKVLQLDNHNISSAKNFFKINGGTTGFFNCSRGVRKGDPLSPLLFCLSEDGLSRALHHAFQAGYINYVVSPAGTTIPSHMLYGDDAFIFCRADKRICVSSQKHAQ
ncbi:uncharacterized protein [Phaseolus vulgaris]|uniref:uncharacterized protein isoform X2 n=2 Tax=Phaseolus vulgaris TaxID=3885 RepID=UPI0035C9B312